MIQLPPRVLPTDADKRLREYQGEVNAERSFAKRVDAAKILFSQRNTPRNATFREVRRVLDEMCSGARRCCYCEDSVADEVEHIKPKDWYPEYVFVWENYLYACGPCNGPKNNRFGVFHPQTDKPVHLEQLGKTPTQAVRAGDPLLIDPRTEDPLAFLELDLSGTFWFLPLARLTGKTRHRAEYTIEVLKLNARDVLRRARRNAYGAYRARLVEYTTRNEKGEDPLQLQTLVDDLRRSPHPTVWWEMKRQAESYPELKDLFDRCPVARLW